MFYGKAEEYQTITIMVCFTASHSDLIYVPQVERWDDEDTDTIIKLIINLLLRC